MLAFRRFGKFPFQPVVKEVEASIRGNQNLLNGVPCDQQRHNNQYENEQSNHKRLITQGDPPALGEMANCSIRAALK